MLNWDLTGEDFQENGKMYEHGKIPGTIRKGTVKGRALWKQYIRPVRNELQEGLQREEVDKSELDRILNNIDKFYYAFYSLSILLDMQRKVKILDSIAYYLRVLIREGLWVIFMGLWLRCTLSFMILIFLTQRLMQEHYLNGFMSLRVAPKEH
ncbi:hypothetical protein [Shigella sonnei]|uniref:hypothetical protein n=1 Tax=Shigella sonnei TaxID=624 RepID=UPI0024051B6C|nr:hypothetical protein [Shigella sonnei]